MKLSNLIENNSFRTCHIADAHRKINKILCSDLHSYALNKLNQNDIWITISANINTLAVAKRKDISCVILADNTEPDNEFITMSKKHGISIVISEYPAFETSLIIQTIKKQYE